MSHLFGDEDATCRHCGGHFENDMELDAHLAMAHEAKWTGRHNQSENGDEDADGAVSPKTADTIATHGGILRPNARERAAVMQGRAHPVLRNKWGDEHPPKVP